MEPRHARQAVAADGRQSADRRHQDISGEQLAQAPAIDLCYANQSPYYRRFALSLKDLTGLHPFLMSQCRCERGNCPLRNYSPACSLLSRQNKACKGCHQRMQKVLDDGYAGKFHRTMLRC